MQQTFDATPLVRLINLLTPEELADLLAEHLASCADLDAQRRRVYDLLQGSAGEEDQALVAERLLDLDSLPDWMQVAWHFGLDESFQYSDVQRLAYLANYLCVVDQDLSSELLEAKYGSTGFELGHPDHPKTTWRAAVAQEETLLGYWAWVAQALKDA